MKLKEAFRYQNTLKDMIYEAKMFLLTRDNITKITEIHKKSTACEDAEDEIKEINKSKNEVEPNVIIDLLYDLVKEKNAVTMAIAEAKKSAKFDLDAAIEVNKLNQELAGVYKKLSNIKSSEDVITGTGYTFNVDGNQTSYVYEIQRTSQINYDREHVRKLQKKLDRESDAKSLEIESLILETEVPIEPKFEVGDTLDDVLETIL